MNHIKLSKIFWLISQGVLGKSTFEKNLKVFLTFKSIQIKFKSFFLHSKLFFNQ